MSFYMLLDRNIIFRMSLNAIILSLQIAKELPFIENNLVAEVKYPKNEDFG